MEGDRLSQLVVPKERERLQHRDISTSYRPAQQLGTLSAWMALISPDDCQLCDWSKPELESSNIRRRHLSCQYRCLRSAFCSKISTASIWEDTRYLIGPSQNLTSLGITSLGHCGGPAGKNAYPLCMQSDIIDSIPLSIGCFQNLAAYPQSRWIRGLNWKLGYLPWNTSLPIRYQRTVHDSWW